MHKEETYYISESEMIQAVLEYMLSAGLLKPAVHRRLNAVRKQARSYLAPIVALGEKHLQITFPDTEAYVIEGHDD